MKMVMGLFKVLQANLQHAIDATSVVVRTIIRKNINLCLIQEPWTGGDGKIRGIGGFKGDVFACKPIDKPRASILSQGLQAELMPQFLTRDLVAIRTKLNGQETIIASAYFSHSSQCPPAEVVRLVEYCKNENLQMLLGCDANAHNEIWGSNDTNERGAELMDFLCEHDLCILNRGSMPTFQNATRSEVLDLTVGCRRVERIVADWQVSEEESLSDHNHIMFNLSKDHTHREEQEFRNPRKTDWDKYKAKLAERIGECPSSLPHGHAIEACCNNITDSIMEAYVESCPLSRKSSSRAVPWWNATIGRLRKRAQTLRNRARRDSSDSLKLAEYQEVRRLYKAEIRAAKRSLWRSFCEEVESLPEATRLQKALSKDRRMVSGPLFNVHTNSYAKSEDEALRVLMSAHFPDCKFEQVSRLSESITMEELHDRHIVNDFAVTAEKIHHAISGFSLFKSPGTDGIIPVMLQKGAAVLVPHLTILFQACLQQSVIPSKWQEVRVTFIPKPGRHDYTQPSAFRPISLSSFLLKTLERVVEWGVRDTLRGHNELHDGQHGFRSGRSTESALHRLVSFLEGNMQNKEMTLCTFLDIEGAFSNVDLPAVGEALRNKNVEPMVGAFLQEMLRKRQIVSTRGQCTLRATVGRGCGQGSVSSPVVWDIIIDELLQILTDEGFYVQAYADDLVVATVGKDQNTIFDLMQRALRIVSDWCCTKSLGVNAKKTQAVLFTKKNKLLNLRLELNGQGIPLSTSVKFLGVHLDSKLMWSVHLDAAIRKAKATLWTLRACFSSTWGLTPKIMRWLYIAVIRPSLSYGCVVWWKRTILETARSKLSKVQRLACIAMTGALRSTPTAALEILTDIAPLHLFLEGEALLCLRRLQQNGVKCRRAPPHGHSIELDQARTAELLMPCDRIVREIIFTGVHATIPSREDWVSQIPDVTPQSIIIYTDGSRMDMRSGAGVYCKQPAISTSLALGRYVTVFQAEVLAIEEAMATCKSLDIRGKDVVVCSDSQAAIRALVKPEVTSAIVKDCKHLCQCVREQNNVRLMWVPGHSGIDGNEKADELARAGSSTTPCGPEPILPVSWATVKKSVQDGLKDKSRCHFLQKSGLRHSKACLGQFSTRRSQEYISRGRGGTRAVAAMLTGHGPFSAHLAKMGIEVATTVCRFCAEVEETGWHILVECPAIWRSRLEHLGFAVDQTANVRLRPGAVHRFTASIGLIC